MEGADSHSLTASLITHHQKCLHSGQKSEVSYPMAAEHTRIQWAFCPLFTTLYSYGHYQLGMQYPSLQLTHSLSYTGHHCISIIKKRHNLKLSNEAIIQLSKIKQDSHSLLSLLGTLLKRKEQLCYSLYSTLELF